MTTGTIHIRDVATRIVRQPIARPVRTSFGTMRDRPMLFVRVRDEDGAEGFGEIWCNFPSVGAEHRARLCDAVVAPLLAALGPVAPDAVFGELARRLHVLAIQSGEWGPIFQVAAGLDAACHDLAARRAGLPLHEYLAPGSAGRIASYASGIGPEEPAQDVSQAFRAGHRAFKVKVGFGDETDHRTLEAARDAIAAPARLMADANQSWTPEAALRAVGAMAEYGLAWMEEPIAADRPVQEWRRLADAAPMPLAGGENLTSDPAFLQFVRDGVFAFVQPDVAKWGGVSGCLGVARAVAGKATYCPHFLGGPVGLLASAHLLAAAGGEGMLEMDVNPNGFRDDVLGDLLAPEDGRVSLPGGPGIGIALDWGAI